MKYTVRRVRLNSQGYESDGQYWGSGMPLYRMVEKESGDYLAEFRAADRPRALAKAQEYTAKGERLGVPVGAVARYHG
jgi:hypothetical protein